MQRSKWAIFLMVLLGIFILIVNGYYGYTVYSDMKGEADLVEVQKYLTSEEKAKKQNQYFAVLKKELEQTINEAKGNGEVGLSFYDIESNTTININENNLFSGASTIKLPAAMLIADEIQSGALSFDTEVWYLSIDYEGGTGKIQENVQPSYTIGELLDFSLKNSDNIAGNMLERQLGGRKEVIKKINEKYLNDPGLNPEENQISTARGTVYLKRLYENPEQIEGYTRVIDDLKDSEFHNCLYTDNTKSVVAHKVGSSESNIHDMGIFYTSHPYLLVVCTNEVENADQLISKLSDIVYTKQVSHYPDANETATESP